MGHLRVDTTASMSARPQKAAVLLPCRALALWANERTRSRGKALRAERSKWRGWR
jgi:hypothetical protein